MPGLQDILNDEPVRREIATLASNGIPLPHSDELGVSADDIDAAVVPEITRVPRHRPTTEAVVRMFGRPVLFIRNGRLELPRSKEMRARLLPAKSHLEARIPSVGRIEFSGHPAYEWAGTGWMIDDGVIVTNRHVAELFVTRRARGFVAKTNPVTGEPIRARLDFREEDRRNVRTESSLEISVRKVLFVERDSRKRPDVAFLLLAADSKLPPPIPVLETDLASEADIAVVGYPAQDPGGVPSSAAARRIFHNRYGVKRLAPGKIMVSEAGEYFFTHDATTLGGNSGSAVLDLQTGAAAGLHFMGDLGEANYAVKADRLARRAGARPQRA